MKSSYLSSVKKQFEYYKTLGEKAIEQVPDDELHWMYNEESNSIAVIVQHIAGNMLSRFTDFLHSDGEKEWRNRDAEFEGQLKNRDGLLSVWNSGWTCLFNAIDAVSEDQLENIVYIRNEGHTVTEAINRQLAHYPYHIGQLIYVAKMITNSRWKNLSIPRHHSSQYNSKKFAEEKGHRHFTDNV